MASVTVEAPLAWRLDGSLLTKNVRAKVCYAVYPEHTGEGKKASRAYRQAHYTIRWLPGQWPLDDKDHVALWRA